MKHNTKIKTVKTIIVILITALLLMSVWSCEKQNDDDYFEYIEETEQNDTIPTDSIINPIDTTYTSYRYMVKTSTQLNSLIEITTQDTIYNPNLNDITISNIKQEMVNLLLITENQDTIFSSISVSNDFNNCYYWEDNGVIVGFDITKYGINTMNVSIFYYDVDIEYTFIKRFFCDIDGVSTSFDEVISSSSKNLIGEYNPYDNDL